MSERYTLEQFERDKAKREEEARKESEQQQERVTKANQKRLWTSDGDTESSFEAAWPRPPAPNAPLLSFCATYNTNEHEETILIPGPHPQPRHRNNKSGKGKARGAKGEQKGSKRGQEHAKRSECPSGIMRQHRAVRERRRRGPW